MSIWVKSSWDDLWTTPISFGLDWSHSVGDRVRNKSHTVTGDILAIIDGYAWVKVNDKHRVSLRLSDLEPAPKPLQVGDRVRQISFEKQLGRVIGVWRSANKEKVWVKPDLDTPATWDASDWERVEAA